MRWGLECRNDDMFELKSAYCVNKVTAYMCCLVGLLLLK